MNCSPLLAEALAVRTRNVQLRKDISQIQNDIQQLEQNLAQLQTKRDELEIQCEILRSKQNDEKQKVFVEKCRREFDNFVRELDDFITTKTFHLPSISDDLNSELTSVENWLMENAVTNVEETPSNIVENNVSSTDDGTDDLYKDLIFPTLNDEDFRPKTPNSQRMDKNQRRFALMRQLAEKSNKTVTRKHL